MATQFDNMIQNAQFRDRANGMSVGGKSAISKVPNKAIRKPLGEISNSNSLKPPQNAVDSTFSRNEKGVQRATISFNRNKNMSKGAKNGTPAGRKPLGDISNSRKPTLPHTSQKTKVRNTNAPELGDPDTDKGFLHNHNECVKTQRPAVDVNYFLETIGHCKGSSPKMALSLHSVTEEVHIEMDSLEMMPDLLPEESSPTSSKAELLMKHKWSPRCESPQSPSLFMQWGNADALDCCLAETPTII